MSGTALLQLSGVVIDLVHRVARLPALGEDVEATDAIVTAGGGFNAMVAAKRFGIDVAYGGPIGIGTFADLARAQMVEAGLSVLANRRRPLDQGTCVVFVSDGGERTFVSRYGAERRWEREDLDRIDAGFYDWVLLNGYALFKPAGARVLASWLSALPAGPLLLFDPSPVVADLAPAVLETVLDRADWVSVNRGESAVLTGLSDPATAAAALASGRAGAIVRCGAEGCWLATPGAPAEHLPGFPVEAVDSTGAGDAHVGAFMAASSLGYGARDAATLANAAAALATTRVGPSAAPSFAETETFLATRGSRLPRPAQGRISGITRASSGDARGPQPGETP